MSKHSSYSYIYDCFATDNADQFIRKRQDKFTIPSWAHYNRTATDHYTAI